MEDNQHAQQNKKIKEKKAKNILIIRGIV